MFGSIEAVNQASTRKHFCPLHLGVSFPLEFFNIMITRSSSTIPQCNWFVLFWLYLLIIMAFISLWQGERGETGETGLRGVNGPAVRIESNFIYLTWWHWFWPEAIHVCERRVASWLVTLTVLWIKSSGFAPCCVLEKDMQLS